jgi:hypothetical protein
MSPVKKTIAILPSFVLAAVIFAAVLSDTDLGSAIISAYVVWAWYWGLVLAWPVYRRLSKYEGNAIDAPMMRVWYRIYYFFPYWCGSVLVGFLGGGIFQFIKFLRSPSHHQSD